MKLRPEEITSILKSRIEDYDVQSDLSEVGTVLQIGDGIARVHGLENCIALERLEFEHGVVGIAFNLEEDNVVRALREWQEVKEASRCAAGLSAERPRRGGAARTRRRPLGQQLDERARSTPTNADARVQGRGLSSASPEEPLQTGSRRSMRWPNRTRPARLIRDSWTGKTAVAMTRS